MSEEAVEIVRRVYHGVARHDPAAVLDAYAPDVEFDFSRSPFRVVLRRRFYRGHDGMRDFFRERYEDAWRDAEDHLDELIDAGDSVVTVVTSRGRGRASGAEVELTHAGVWTVAHGKVKRVVWLTHEDALKAAGLSE